MKISKLLNRKYLSIIIIFLALNLNSLAEEKPVDIWKIDKENKDKDINNNVSISGNEQDLSNPTDIYNMQSKNKNISVKIEQSLDTQEVKIIGLYDPEDYGLEMSMWLNSNGDQLKNIFSNLIKINLSEDATELMNILLLTNAYYPSNNISEKEFLKIKSDWLIRNNDLELIEKYLVKNQILNLHPELTRFLVDEYLSRYDIAKACEIFSENNEPIANDYLLKFNIYCLVKTGRKEEAQLILDLKKELGFKDTYFEQKLNFLLGYTEIVDKSISERSILDFHLAHSVNPEFKFEPIDNTNKLIWKYLSSANLLYKIDEIKIEEIDKISIIEKATNDKNFSEDDLFEVYKRFQFNINQFLNATDIYKSLSNIEARALIYQKILLESETSKKLELIKILKNLFIDENISNAFDQHLKKFLKDLDPDEIPSNYSTFYSKYLKEDQKNLLKIKYNNDVLHQAKLVNYFNGDYTKQKIEKDLNNFLKKIKKNKKYFLSKKDIILIESLKSDGIKISKKYDNLYEINESEIPTDIQVMVNNNEIGATILRIIEVIGQDKLEALDEDTLYFIVSALNQLNVDFIRNNILLKVLPLKV